MKIDREQWICKRAYALWEEAGRPQGTDQDNWSKAVAEFEMMETIRASADGSEILRFRRRQKRAPARIAPAAQMVA